MGAGSDPACLVQGTWFFGVLRVAVSSNENVSVQSPPNQVFSLALFQELSDWGGHSWAGFSLNMVVPYSPLAFAL